MTLFQKLEPGSVGRRPESLGNDPYFYWAEASKFIDYVPHNSEAPASFLTVFQASKGHKCADLLAYINWGGLNNGRVLSKWSDNIGTVFGVALLSPYGLERLAEKAAVANGAIRFETSLLLRDPRPLREPSKPFLDAHMPSATVKSASPVLLGVVDYGCPFAHIGLRSSTDTTRILSLWDQGNNVSESKELGRTFSRSDLSGFMATAKTPSGSVDEAACYRQNGFDSLASRDSHGAHMLGLLAGAAASPSLFEKPEAAALPNKPWKDTATSSDIVFVQLPPEYLQSMPRTGLAPYQLMAMKYILDSAGKNTSHVIIPVSSEAFEGPHDGSSLLESAIDALVEYALRERKKTLDIVFASGNTADLAVCLKLPDSKPSIKSPTTHATCFSVRVLPDNELPTFVEIWFASGVPDMNISVKPPDQVASRGLEKGSWVWPNADAPECAVIHPQTVQACGKGKLICIRIAPTFSATIACGIASFGDWSFTLSAADPLVGGWAYVARSYHGVGGHRRSYQSYFPDYPRSDDWELLNDPPHARKGLGSINGLACGSNVLVVSGYILRPRKQTGDGVSAIYAGRGPTRGGRLAHSTLVDRAAPTEESMCLSGIKSWGNLSGASIRMNGTSVAAPIAARELAQFGWLCGSATSDPNCEPQLEPRGRLG